MLLLSTIASFSISIAAVVIVVIAFAAVVPYVLISGLLYKITGIEEQPNMADIPKLEITKAYMGITQTMISLGLFLSTETYWAIDLHGKIWSDDRKKRKAIIDKKEMMSKAVALVSWLLVVVMYVCIYVWICTTVKGWL